MEPSEEAIQKEIMSHGSVTAEIAFYENFYHPEGFKQGVYQCDGEGKLGYHGVKLVSSPKFKVVCILNKSKI